VLCFDNKTIIKMVWNDRFERCVEDDGELNNVKYMKSHMNIYSFVTYVGLFNPVLPAAKLSTFCSWSDFYNIS